MAYDEWPSWINLNGRVPCVPAPPEHQGVTLQYIEQMRRKAWVEAPFVEHKGVQDWDPEEGSYPATRMGTCRHKATWLVQKIGGVVLYGRRTDKANAGLHAVVWVRRGNHGFIVDQDGIWPEQSAPWVCDASSRAYK